MNTDAERPYLFIDESSSVEHYRFQTSNSSPSPLAAILRAASGFFIPPGNLQMCNYRAPIGPVRKTNVM